MDEPFSSLDYLTRLRMRAELARMLDQLPRTVVLVTTDEELQRIHDMAIKAGILQKPIEMKDLVDRRFIPADIKPANIEVNR